MKRLLAFALSVALALSALSAQDSRAVTVSSPNGAPGLALALLAEQTPGQYTYVAAETIAAEFINNRVDFIVAPVNVGAKLYKMKKSTYRLAAVVTWGNLYFASQRKNFTLADISGADITLFGENTITASVARFVLAQNKITARSIGYLAGAANTQSLLLSDTKAIVLTAEPALTAAALKNRNITAHALNDLFKTATGFDGFAQAGLFVRAKTLQERPQAVRDYLKRAEEACALCTNDVARAAKAAVALELLSNATVAERAIPNCAIRYVGAREAQSQVEATARIDLAQFGGAVPADDFYCR